MNPGEANIPNPGPTRAGGASLLAALARASEPSSRPPPPVAPEDARARRSSRIPACPRRLLGALLLMVGLGLCGVVLGCILTRRFAHAYLVWNTFLAFVPLGLALAMEDQERRGRTFVVGVLAVPWLLFLPNAPYLLTDFIHLRGTPRTWIWGHWLMLVWFSFTGLMAGLVSVRIVHRLWERRYGRMRALAAVTLANLLCGVGVALGRFQRWNSWDILHRPFDILVDVLRHASGASPGMETLAAMGTGAFFAGAYLVIWALESPSEPSPSLAPGPRSG